MATELERTLTDWLSKSGDQSWSKLQAYSLTFQDIINSDSDFGHLLRKIKQAYDEYLLREDDKPLETQNETDVNVMAKTLAERQARID